MIFLEPKIKSQTVTAVIRRMRFNNVTKTGGFDQILLKISNCDIRVLELPLREPNLWSLLSISVSKNAERSISRSRLYKIPTKNLGISILISEVLTTVFLIVELLRQRQRLVAYSANSGSSAVVFLFRKFGLIRLWLQHFPDYSPPTKRFESRYLSQIFAFLTKLAWQKADAISFPSQRITEALQGAYGNRVGPSFLIPNMPPVQFFATTSKLITSQPRVVFSAGSIEPKYDFASAIKGLARLHEVELLILGGMPDVEYIKNLSDLAMHLNVGQRVKFLGLLPLKDVVQLVHTCHFGLALYNQDQLNPHLLFGDSIKVREYAASGLVTLGTNWVSPVQELADAGGGISLSSNAHWAEAVSECLRSKDVFSGLSRRARDWSHSQEQFTQSQIGNLGSSLWPRHS